MSKFIVESPTTTTQEIHTLNCLSEVERLKQFLTKEKTTQNPPYEFKLIKLLEWTNKELEFDGHFVNLFNLTCSCKESLKKSKIYSPNDLRLVCKHIFKKIIISQKHKKIFNNLDILLMESVVTVNEKMLVKLNLKGGVTFYIGVNDQNNFFNIYCENIDKWEKYVYLKKKRKWKEDKYPENAKGILEAIKRNEFIFDKYLGEGK